MNVLVILIPVSLALGGLAATLAVAGGAGVATYRRLAR